MNLCFLHFRLPLEFSVTEALEQFNLHHKRREALSRAEKDRQQSAVANYLASWFPPEHERLVIPVDQGTAAGSGIPDDYDPDTYDQTVSYLISYLGDFGYTATPDLLAQNLVYDSQRNVTIKTATALDRIISNPDILNRVDWIRGHKPDSDQGKARLRKLWKDYLDMRSYKEQTTGKERWVIVSRNFADVASMSTGRPWTSCMSLERGEGERTRSLFKGLVAGMLVAYLVEGNRADVDAMANDTTQPIEAVARIAIKPFKKIVSKPRPLQAAAWPERRIYHQNRANTSGFYETVVTWVKSKIGKLEQSGNGRWRLLGGYTDTLDDNSVMNYMRSPEALTTSLRTKLGFCVAQLRWLHNHGGVNGSMDQDSINLLAAVMHLPDESVTDEILKLAKALVLAYQPTTDRNTIVPGPRRHLTTSEIWAKALFERFPGLLSKGDSLRLGSGLGRVLGHYNTQLGQALFSAITGAKEASTQGASTQGTTAQGASTQDNQLAMLKALGRLRKVLEVIVTTERFKIYPFTLDHVQAALDKLKSRGLDVSAATNLCHQLRTRIQPH